jgi:hypothetical protein
VRKVRETEKTKETYERTSWPFPSPVSRCSLRRVVRRLPLPASTNPSLLRSPLPASTKSPLLPPLRSLSLPFDPTATSRRLGSRSGRPGAGRGVRCGWRLNPREVGEEKEDRT